MELRHMTEQTLANSATSTKAMITAPRTGNLLRSIVARCALMLIVVCGSGYALRAQSVEEHEAKAAFVLRLINFVQWPNEAGQSHASLVIGIIGTDATSDALQRLASGKSVDGRTIVVRRLNPQSELENCQVLFIDASERNHVVSLLERIHGRSVLTVGESDGFGRMGGVVNLTLREGRIHLEVNIHAAERSQLRINSSLLSLATLVSDGA